MAKSNKKTERLDKVLSNNGFGTRKEVGWYLKTERVYVNGEIVRDGATHVDIGSDEIEVDGEPLFVKEHLHLMMNKKGGYVCSAKEGEHSTVFDLLDGEESHKYLGGELNMVGRLDIDTEGLLIFTTDGTLNHYLTSPKNRIPKTYLVYLGSKVSAGDKTAYAEKIASGVHIAAEGHEDEADCLPGILEWKNGDDYVNQDKEHPAEACTLTVYEGKFHEVKRIFAALGNEVVYLKRIFMGGLSLDESLSAGQYRELTAEEVWKLRSN